MHSTSSQHTIIDIIPKEILRMHIFPLLDAKSLVRAGRVCKKWHEYIHEPKIFSIYWQSLFAYDFQYTPIPTSRTFKELHIQRSRLLKNLETFNYTEWTIDLPLKDDKYPFIKTFQTTHYIILHTGIDLLCYDQVNHKEVPHIFNSTKYLLQDLSFIQIDTDILLIHYPLFTTDLNVQVSQLHLYDVTHKEQTLCLIETPGILPQNMCITNPDKVLPSIILKDTLVYFNSKGSLSVFDIRKKELTTFDHIAFTSLYGIAQDEEIVAFIAQDTIQIVNIFSGHKIYELDYKSIGFSVSDTMPAVLRNNSCVICDQTQNRFLVIDCTAKTAQVIVSKTPLPQYCPLFNERFFVFCNINTEQCYIWDCENFTEDPKIIDSPNVPPQLIDGERMLTLNYLPSDYTTIDIWNLTTGSCERSLSYKTRISPMKPISCANHIAWIQAEQTQVLKDITESIFIDIATGKKVQHHVFHSFLSTAEYGLRDDKKFQAVPYQQLDKAQFNERSFTLSINTQNKATVKHIEFDTETLHKESVSGTLNSFINRFKSLQISESFQSIFR